jgi:hypothetical protein
MISSAAAAESISVPKMLSASGIMLRISPSSSPRTSFSIAN